MASDAIRPNRQAIEQARELSSEILADIELGRGSLAQAALKSSRLARLLNDENSRKIFQYEAGGYPTESDGIPHEVFILGEKAGRVKEEKDKNGQVVRQMSTLSIEAIQAHLDAAKNQLASAQDAPYSVSSANPQQILPLRVSNREERDALKVSIRLFSSLLSECRTRIYNYALERMIELSYSEIASDIFSRVQIAANENIAKLVPDAVTKFSSIYDNLQSDNAEDWANAVHTCRRILQALADALFPTRPDEVRNGRSVKLGKDNYVNRLICFVEDKSSSQRFEEIVGSHLKFIGERLDAIFRAAQKGSHDGISSREEADRYVVYTYMVVHDLLTLLDQSEP